MGQYLRGGWKTLNVDHVNYLTVKEVAKLMRVSELSTLRWDQRRNAHAAFPDRRRTSIAAAIVEPYGYSRF